MLLSPLTAAVSRDFRLKGRVGVFMFSFILQSGESQKFKLLELFISKVPHSNGFATVALNGTESSSLGALPSQSQSITEDSVCNEIFQ